MFMSLNLLACGENNVPAQDISSVELPLLEGGVEKISKWSGKIIVLNVWATWCVPCRKEMPELQKLSSELNKDKVVILGLAVDQAPLLVKEYLYQNGIDFANHIDLKKQITQGVLGISKIPQTLVIDSKGIVRDRSVGYRSWNKEELEKKFSKLGMTGF